MRIDLGPDSDLPQLVRAATSESVVVVIVPELCPIAMAAAIAAIAPLAEERAPATRVNAVTPAAGAAAADIDAAVAFLKEARSTTGQVLAIS